MRVRSEIWVRAYLRRCEVAGVPAVVVRRGDEDAGAIFVSINCLNGTVRLYGPAPAGLESSRSDRRWIACLGEVPVQAAEADRYLTRETNIDPDIWIIEIEERGGRHLLVETELG